MAQLDPEVSAYYERGGEQGRLDGGLPSGPLERARTQELILRHLPDAPTLRVLDVGGGPGAYAAWLANLGHAVTLVDPVPLHVEQARAAHPGVRAELGDARALPHADGAFDVVLLLGPLGRPRPSRRDAAHRPGDRVRAGAAGGRISSAGGGAHARRRMSTRMSDDRRHRVG